MSIHLLKQTFSIQSFTQKLVNCAKMKMATKQRIMQIIKKKNCIPTLIPLWYSVVNPFGPFNPIVHNKFFPWQPNFMKTTQNRDRQHIFDKTVNAQSQDFTQAQIFYTSSARDAHDIFHA